MNLISKLSALMTTAILAVPSAAALELKAADIHPEGYPSVVAMQNMGQKLAAITKGRITLKIYPGGMLGDETAMLEQAQNGSIDMLRTSLGTVGPVVPEVNVFNMPYVFRDEAHMRKVIDGSIGTELLQKITDSPANLVALGWMEGGTRNLYTRKPVRKPADLAGQKIRMMANPLFLDTMNAMGGSGIPMGFGELFGAMQTGTIDGAENNVPSYVSQSHFTGAKYYNLTGHLIIPEVFVFSKLRWNKLSPKDQALIRTLSKQTQMEQRQLWDKRVAVDTARMKAANVTIVADVDRQAFFKATQPVRDKYGTAYSTLIKRIEAVK